MKLKLLTATLSAAILTLGSASVWSQEQKPIDCSTASDDITHLQHEKKSVDDRKVKGVLAITPIGLVTNAVTSGEHDKSKEMEINEYNQKITDRINDIKQTCNIQ